ncbi:MAG: hypothetical protein JWR75_695 [Devosia sp.]|nr:hypothetical protein [Devosia sp.]
MREFGRIGGLLLAMLLVGTGFVLVIAIGFRISGDWAPPEFTAVVLPAVILFPLGLLGVALIVALGWWPDPSLDWPTDWLGFRRRRWARESRLLSAESRRRINELAADPATRKYAEDIRAGSWWSDEAIAYDRDPTQLVTCAHLQPIEAAMRSAGLVLKPNWRQSVFAHCHIDATRLAAQFDIAAPVDFNGHIEGDRPYEPESAAIICREHGSWIGVLHEDERKLTAPVFPKP